MGGTISAPTGVPVDNNRVLAEPINSPDSAIIHVEPTVPHESRRATASPGLFPAINATAYRGPPPSYEEANDPNAPPPSYDSLFGRVREVHKSSSGFWDFLKNLFFYLLGKIGLMIVIGITTIVPICMLVVGSVYVNDCPAQRYIPVYLIVGGAFGLIKQMLSLKIGSLRSRQADLEVPDSSLNASIRSLITSFLICWFITGCYWVYGAYEPNFKDPSSLNFCNYTLYAFSFWLLSSVFIFVGSVIFLLCCISSTALLFNREQ